MTHKDRALVIAVILVSALLSAGLNAWYTTRVDSRSNKNWCELIVTLDDRNQGATTPTPEQKEFARLISDLRRRQGCPT